MPHRGPKKQKFPHHPRTRKTSALKYVGHGTDQERAALLERLPDAFVSVDPHWQFTYINRQVEALVGKGREELLGRNVWDIFPIPADSLLYRNAHKAMDMQTTLEFTQFHLLCVIPREKQLATLGSHKIRLNPGKQRSNSSIMHGLPKTSWMQ